MVASFLARHCFDQGDTKVVVLHFLRFHRWLDETRANAGGLSLAVFEEVRRHLGVEAAHSYGSFCGILTAWCESHQIPYSGVAVVASWALLLNGRSDWPRSLLS